MLFNNRSGAIERTDNSVPLYEHSVDTPIAYFVCRNKLGIFLISFSTVCYIVRTIYVLSLSSTPNHSYLIMYHVYWWLFLKIKCEYVLFAGTFLAYRILLPILFIALQFSSI
jgi:hypothetical protein